MSLTNVKAEVTSKFPLPKKGLRLGTLSGIIDCGIQQREFQGVAKSPCRQIMLVYTLANDTYVDDNGEKQHSKISVGPFGLFPGNDKGKYMTHVKALDPEAQVLSSKGEGDISKLLGKSCFLTISHTDPTSDGKVYANVEGAAQLPEDYAVPKVPFVPVFFDTTSPDPVVAAMLTKYQKDILRKSQGYAGSKLEQVIDGTSAEAARGNPDSPSVDDEDAPF